MHRELVGRFSSAMRLFARLPFEESTALRPPSGEGAAVRLLRRRLTAGLGNLESSPSDGRISILLSSHQCVTCRSFCSSAEAYRKRETLYTKSHEYMRFMARDSSKAVVGISEFASEELGEVAFVEAFVSVEREGARVNKGDPVCMLEALKSVAEVYAPVSGRVVKFNEKVKEDPALINRDPEGEGWIFVIDVDPIERPTEEQSRQDAFKPPLLSAAEYATYFGCGSCCTIAINGPNEAPFLFKPFFG
ncbi:hypothetical protein Esti_001410 [Eimeria stiedai]